MVMKLLGASVFAALMVGGTAAPAQPSSKEAQRTDPHEQIICEKIVVTGSRLSSKRVCGTRAEWAERRLRDRQEVERAQLSPCVVTHSTSTGRPACH
jgi:hypothetical protein